MCGILGQINRHGEVDQSLFQSMLETLASRGPDQQGCYFDRNIALGHRRLSIIDLSEAGRQPMPNEDKTVYIVFNGEIYNYLHVKTLLKQQHVWQSRTDTEVLIHGYEENGQVLLQTIEGMFAFAILDREKQVLTLARDHFGKKPLYYYLDDKCFVFASEIKALLRNPRIKANLRVNHLSLLKFLFYGYIPSPNTLFDKIRKLEPATTLQFDISQWQIIHHERYWKLEDMPPRSFSGEDQVLDSIDHLLQKAVEKRLMSDVPLGVFLSGGLDSSLITAYLSKLQPNIHSFTVTYPDAPEADESSYAEEIARHLNLPHHAHAFDRQMVRPCFEKIFQYMDEPFADAAIIPLYFLARIARAEVTVALGGDGGDEIFGGYPKYRAQRFIERYASLGWLFHAIQPLIPRGNPYYKLAEGFSLSFPIRQFIFGSGSFLPDEIRQLVHMDNLNLDLVFEDAFRASERFRRNDVINKSLYLDCMIQLPDWYLVKCDQATMATSLEMRNPLLDKALAEYAFGLQSSFKIHGNEQKHILKKLATRFFPPELVYRPKRGFGAPLDHWLRKELREMVEATLNTPDPFLKMDFVQALWKDHLSGQADHRFKLLRIFALKNTLLKTGIS